MTNEDNVYQDWLEFKTEPFRDEKTELFVNLKRSEISEVFQVVVDNRVVEEWTNIVMKNGRVYVVHMPYNKVMELV